MTPRNPGPPISREEFVEFLHLFTHEIRNRLNAIGLEAANLAEQPPGEIDIGGLERQIRDCSTFLKTVRDTLAPGEPAAPPAPLAEITARLRSRDWQ